MNHYKQIDLSFVAAKAATSLDLQRQGNNNIDYKPVRIVETFFKEAIDMLYSKNPSAINISLIRNIVETHYNMIFEKGAKTSDLARLVEPFPKRLSKAKKIKGKKLEDLRNLCVTTSKISSEFRSQFYHHIAS